MAVTMTIVVTTSVLRRLSFVFSKESHKPHAEHVERSKKRSDQADDPVNPAGLIGPPQNFVFAEKSGKWRNTSDGNRPSRHRPESPWNLCAQATHLAHILLAVDR